MRERIARRAATGALIVALVGGCAGATGPSAGGAAANEGPLPSGIECHGATCHYEDITFGFDYPASWRAAYFPVMTSFSTDLVNLSTSPMSDPCDRTPDSMTCSRLAAGHIGPGGLLVTWRARGFPDWSFDPNVGTSLAVGGRRGTLEQFDATEDCHAIGGSRELKAIIPRPAEWNWMEMDACLAGPDLAPATTQIETMLYTVTWKD